MARQGSKVKTRQDHYFLYPTMWQIQKFEKSCRDTQPYAV